MPNKTPITKHFYKRAEQRFALKINRKARVELEKWIESTKHTELVHQTIRRVVIRIPIFVSKKLVELNPDVKFGDFIIGIYDQKINRIITVMPYYDKDGYNFESNYKKGEAKW
jgi:hypothetical protein